jgi:hypothetical protein
VLLFLQVLYIYIYIYKLRRRLFYLPAVYIIVPSNPCTVSYF